MIIRSPIRTKTKSFRGDQIDFKFPSTESLPRGTMEEYHLNNHHLLNNTLGGENPVTHDEDATSQILSDYTSASNTNTNSGYSSNGYYSFANISDNTTSSPRIIVNPNEATNRLTSSDSNKSDYFASHDVQNDDSLHYSSSSVVRNQLHSMEVIPEGNVTGSVSSAFQTIPTAENVSYNIASSSASSISSKGTTPNGTLQPTQEAETIINPKLEKHEEVIKQKKPVPECKKKLNRVPTIKQVGSLKSSNSRYNSSASSRSTSARGSLKRSKAIRCKGGLLHYFTSLGIRIKKTLHRLRSAIRRKLFSFNDKNATTSICKNSKIKTQNNKKSKKRQADLIKNKDLSTSRHKKAQRYVSNLQRSISSKSLVPVLAPLQTTKPLEIDTNCEATVSESKEPTVGPKGPKSPLVRYTPSLRRTNSSIRRAASILTTSATMTPVNNRNSFISVSESVNNAVTRNSSAYSRSRLVRSKPSTSLNAIARQPSIVVENRVIPLSMNRFSIKEEDEYVIDTTSMRELSPVNSVSSSDYDQKSLASHSDHADAMETIEAIDEDETGNSKSIQEDNLKSESVSNDVSYDLMKHYLSTVIAQRIMLRVQIARLQDSKDAVYMNKSAETNSTIYEDLVDSLLIEYQADGNSSQILDDVLMRDEDEEEEEEEEEEEKGDVLVEEIDQLANLRPIEKERNLSITLRSPFAMLNSAYSNSIISLPTGAVKRSLTLPVGIKI